MKKLIAIAICMLFFATVPTFVGSAQNTKSDVSPNTGHYTSTGNNAMWDVLLNFDVDDSCGSVYNAGTEFDGTYIYGSEFNNVNFFYWDTAGNYVGTFTIAGTTSIRDMAFDGTYMYGGMVTNTIYQMDFTTHTLVGTIPTGTPVRGCAYDPVLDGFWVSDWSTNIVCYGRDGTQLATITTPLTSKYGLAYDSWTPGGPYLWVFDQTDGTQQVLHQLDIATGAEVSTHDVNGEIANAGIAGGLWITPDFQSGTLCLGGLSQATPDRIFVYDIGTTNAPPTVPVITGPSTGILGKDYTFSATCTEPDNEDCYIRFDWGDGNISDWVGPFASGGSASASHAWSTVGTFNVKAQSKDSVGSQSAWSDPHAMNIVEAPVLKIVSVSGTFFKLKAEIGNTGVVPATNVTWWINFTGGAFIGKTTTGQIANIDPNAQAEVTSKMVFGFGKTHLTITASSPDSTATMEKDLKILLFFFKF